MNPNAEHAVALEALSFLLTRIASWTTSRWDQHLRYEYGDEKANVMIAEIRRITGLPDPKL